ncbi:hypothetical protein GGR58DRAFT_525700 [Xylaria digitata]|nr:hypothetical protein GGR58DRAFT_525700 [Xylaria digitata]
MPGEGETKVAPDWVVIYGDPTHLTALDKNIIALGDTKLKSGLTSDGSSLPDTIACPEPYLAQVVQYCIDAEIPLGFVLTNYELVVFHLVKYDFRPNSERYTTRASNPDISEWLLPSDATEEREFSSPLQRKTGDWPKFDEGDNIIHFVSKENNPNTPASPSEWASSPPGQEGNEPLSPEPHHHHTVMPGALFSQPYNQRHTTPELPNSSQQSSLCPDSTPCRNARGRGVYTPITGLGLSSPQRETISQGTFTPDPRAEAPTHVLIKSYPAGDEGVAQRLFELCMLAKAAKDNGVLNIGPWKLSFEALHALSTSR